MAEDRFETFSSSMIGPIEFGFDVTPSDSADLSHVSRAIMVGASGNVRVTLRSKQTITLTGLQVGVVYPFRVNKVWATGTTATGVQAFY